jgi:transcriptional regulator with XRE-family HTH domain
MAKKQTLRDRAKSRRKELGLTQQQVADRSHPRRDKRFTANQVAKVEMGQPPNTPTLICLARGLQCSIDWLLGLTGGEITLADLDTFKRPKKRRKTA